MCEAMQWRVAVDEEETTAIFEPGARDAQAVFVCAHGAGGHREDRGMVRLAAVLRPRGVDLVPVHFLYPGNGSRPAHAMPRPKRCPGAVFARTPQELCPRRLLIGGGPPGGRGTGSRAPPFGPGC